MCQWRLRASPERSGGFPSAAGRREAWNRTIDQAYFDFFFSSFAVRFSFSVFSGFFFVVFFESMPLLMVASRRVVVITD